MVIELLKLDYPRSVYIGYFLFKNVEKEIMALFESLKKETTTETNSLYSSNQEQPFK